MQGCAAPQVCASRVGLATNTFFPPGNRRNALERPRRTWDVVPDKDTRLSRVAPAPGARPAWRKVCERWRKSRRAPSARAGRPSDPAVTSQTPVATSASRRVTSACQLVASACPTWTTAARRALAAREEPGSVAGLADLVMRDARRKSVPAHARERCRGK